MGRVVKDENGTLRLRRRVEIICGRAANYSPSASLVARLAGEPIAGVLPDFARGGYSRLRESWRQFALAPLRTQRGRSRRWSTDRGRSARWKREARRVDPTVRESKLSLGRPAIERPRRDGSIGARSETVRRSTQPSRTPRRPSHRARFGVRPGARADLKLAAKRTPLMRLNRCPAGARADFYAHSLRFWRRQVSIGVRLGARADATQ